MLLIPLVRVSLINVGLGFYQNLNFSFLGQVFQYFCWVSKHVDWGSQHIPIFLLGLKACLLRFASATHFLQNATYYIKRLLQSSYIIVARKITKMLCMQFGVAKNLMAFGGWMIYGVFETNRDLLASASSWHGCFNINGTQTCLLSSYGQFGIKETTWEPSKPIVLSTNSLNWLMTNMQSIKPSNLHHFLVGRRGESGGNHLTRIFSKLTLTVPFLLKRNAQVLVSSFEIRKALLLFPCLLGFLNSSNQ